MGEGGQPHEDVLAGAVQANAVVVVAVHAPNVTKIQWGKGNVRRQYSLGRKVILISCERRVTHQ